MAWFTLPVPWRTAVRMTRPGFLGVTAVACMLGLATALAAGVHIAWVSASVTVALAVLAHAAGNVLNDFHDDASGADAANTQGLFPFTGGARLIQNGEVTARDTLHLAIMLLAPVVAGGLWLVTECGSGLLLIGGLGVLLGWAYSAPPFALMSRGLGELTVAATWWLIVVGADYTQRGAWSAAPMLAAVSFALLMANILLINGVPDAESDASVGKRTPAVRLGPGGTATLYLATVMLSHGWLMACVLLSALPSAALWGLLSLPMALAAGVLLRRDAGQPQRLRPAIALTIGAGNLHGLAMAVALTVHAWN